LLRQLGNSQFHRAINWDASNPFILVDPSVGIQRLLCVFVRGFQIFHALLCPYLFVITSARRGSNHCEYDYAKQCEEKHDP